MAGRIPGSPGPARSIHTNKIRLMEGTITRTLNNLTTAGIHKDRSALIKAVNSTKLGLNAYNLMPLEVALVNMSTLLAINTVRPLDEYAGSMIKLKQRINFPRGQSTIFRRFVAFCAKQRNYGELTFWQLLKELNR